MDLKIAAKKVSQSPTLPGKKDNKKKFDLASLLEEGLFPSAGPVVEKHGFRNSNGVQMDFVRVETKFLPDGRGRYHNIIFNLQSQANHPREEFLLRKLGN
ncbi:hypothetical protein [Leptospira ilyithenensis]|uniref:Uncharacterized protein n=1 Tax=Leptospira ilyithenensis TaxID=2484901 RepID=A0A4R9LND5_9LEPT|nr:hypothetical protein [Leptospira ilyithenensis]TGN06962.1 hypothetical protein EHS11_17685 [Leptospira ilyithenensis]